MTIIVCYDIEKNLDFTEDLESVDNKVEIERADIVNYLLQRGKALDDFMHQWKFTPYEIEQMFLTHNKLAKLRIKNHIKVEHDR